MMPLNFSKKYQDKIYSYYDVVRPYPGEKAPLKGLSETSYREQMDLYLSFAMSLTDDLDKYVVLRSSPHNDQKLKIYSLGVSNWFYRFVANDIEGIGIDHGFQNKENGGTELQLVTKLPDPAILKNLPEDSFGEEVSQISLFGLVKNREEDLKRFMQQENQPLLKDFLKPRELFVNIVVSKAEPVFHTMLIKSIEDIHKTIISYPNAGINDN